MKNDDREKEIEAFYQAYGDYAEAIDNVFQLKPKTKRKEENKLAMSVEKDKTDSGWKVTLAFTTSQDFNEKVSKAIDKVQAALDKLKADLYTSSQD